MMTKNKRTSIKSATRAKITTEGTDSFPVPEQVMESSDLLLKMILTRTKILMSSKSKYILKKKISKSINKTLL